MKNKPLFITYKNSDFENAAALFFKKILSDLLISNEIVNIALSGGGTPLPIYEKLKEYDLEWERINFFLVDERCVPIKDTRSNFGNIKNIFFDFVHSKTFSIVKEGISFDEATKHYSEEILKCLPVINNIPKFDLIILGMGLDGHTASLFPNTLALEEKNKLIVLNDIPQLGEKRITMTFPLIENASKIVLLIKGDNKKKVLNECFDKKLPIMKLFNHLYAVLS